MGFDRAATLRQAEKLLTQGKLDAAIAAYASVVEQQPTDWNTRRRPVSAGCGGIAKPKVAIPGATAAMAATSLPIHRTGPRR